MCAFIFVCFHRLVCRLLSCFGPAHKLGVFFSLLDIRSPFVHSFPSPVDSLKIRNRLSTAHWNGFDCFVRSFCPRTTRIEAKRLFSVPKQKEKKTSKTEKKIISFTQVQNRAINHFSVCVVFSATSFFFLFLSRFWLILFDLLSDRFVAVAIFAFFLLFCSSALKSARTSLTCIPIVNSPAEWNVYGEKYIYFLLCFSLEIAYYDWHWLFAVVVVVIVDVVVYTKNIFYCFSRQMNRTHQIKITYVYLRAACRVCYAVHGWAWAHCWLYVSFGLDFFPCLLAFRAPSSSSPENIWIKWDDNFCFVLFNLFIFFGQQKRSCKTQSIYHFHNPRYMYNIHEHVYEMTLYVVRRAWKQSTNNNSNNGQPQ